MIPWTVLLGVAGATMMGFGLLGKFAAGMASSGVHETPTASRLLIGGSLVVALSVLL
jgi:hypothetical protein